MRRLRYARNLFRISAFATIVTVLLALGGCATPVGVRHLDSKQVQRNLTANILSSDELSSSTRQILNRADLTERFRSDPSGVLAELHKGLPTASEADRLFALAELSYAYASENKSELIVNSGHSTQDHPETIEEVRRILLEHLREAAG
jgi:hypothetical protein